jgi:hypothetical protein
MGAIVLFKILIPNANVPLNPDVVFLQTRMLIDGHRPRSAYGKWQGDEYEQHLDVQQLQ